MPKYTIHIRRRGGGRSVIKCTAVSKLGVPVTLHRVLHEWLENACSRLKPQTYTDYRYMVDRHILPTLGMLAVAEVDTVCINAFLEEKSRRGRLDGRGGLSPSYVKKLRFLLSAAVEYAAAQGYRSPLEGSPARPPKRRPEPQVLSVGEQQRLEAYMLTDTDTRKLGVLLSLYAGLRIGEVCGLRWKDIDLERQTIHIRHTVERVKLSEEESGRKTRLVLGDTKSRSSDRVIPIPPKLLPALQARQQEGERFLLEGNTYAYTDPRTYQYSFRRYLTACRLRPINYHALRHTFATRCVESGMDVKSLSELLGHANINVTLTTYVHSSLEHKRRQMETMAAYCCQLKQVQSRL